MSVRKASKSVPGTAPALRDGAPLLFAIIVASAALAAVSCSNGIPESKTCPEGESWHDGACLSTADFCRAGVRNCCARDLTAAGAKTCAADFACVFPAADAETGTCSAACTPDIDPTCAAGTVCVGFCPSDATPGINGVCLQSRADGKACTPPLEACMGGSKCLVPGGAKTGSCSPSCTGEGDAATCPAGSRCIKTEKVPVCEVTPQEAGFHCQVTNRAEGAPCDEATTLCDAGLDCVLFSGASTSICVTRCDPAAPSCPDARTCYARTDPEGAAAGLGACDPPPGDAPEGAACDDAVVRCTKGHVCTQESPGTYVCRARCQPACGSGDPCDTGRWCIPLSGGHAGICIRTTGSTGVNETCSDSLACVAEHVCTATLEGGALCRRSCLLGCAVDACAPLAKCTALVGEPAGSIRGVCITVSQ